MNAVRLTVVVDEDNVETGLWCQRCLLPSGWRVPVLSLSLLGVGQLGVIARCDECEKPLNAT